jgi:hypothetical protein
MTVMMDTAMSVGGVYFRRVWVPGSALMKSLMTQVSSR